MVVKSWGLISTPFFTFGSLVGVWSKVAILSILNSCVMQETLSIPNCITSLNLGLLLLPNPLEADKFPYCYKGEICLLP
jgi:hypothetical protein